MKKLFIKIVVLIAIIYMALAIILPSIYVMPILMYHHIGEQKQDILYVSLEDFDKQMKFLRDKKYNIIRLQELVDMIVWNRKIPPKTIVITFDDGYEDNFRNAYPILKKYNIPTIIFAIPGHCDWPGYLNKEQLKELSRDGIDIGSHTLNDVWLPSRDDNQLKKEIVDSKKALEEITGKRIDFFCYPLGGFNERVRSVVMKAGYKGACATRGRARVNNDIYALKRIKISGKRSGNLIKFWFNTSGYATWVKEHKRKNKK